MSGSSDSKHFHRESVNQKINEAITEFYVGLAVAVTLESSGLVYFCVLSVCCCGYVAKSSCLIHWHNSQSPLSWRHLLTGKEGRTAFRPITCAHIKATELPVTLNDACLLWSFINLCRLVFWFGTSATCTDLTLDRRMEALNDFKTMWTHPCSLRGLSFRVFDFDAFSPSLWLTRPWLHTPCKQRQRIVLKLGVYL